MSAGALSFPALRPTLGAWPQRRFRSPQHRLMFRLKLLGGSILMGEGGKATVTPRRRLALLALLAVAGERGVSREKLLAFLWPEGHAADTARHALEQFLSTMRRQFGDTVFQGTDPLQLNPLIVTSDVAELETMLARGELEEAVALYGGPFLDGFFLSNAGEFERWVESERARFADHYVRALRRLAREDEARGDHGAAARWWRHVVGADPFGAEGNLALMQELAASGDRAGALRHARVYEALLRDQLEVPPDAAVTRLEERLRAEAATLSPSVAPPPPTAPVISHGQADWETADAAANRSDVSETARSQSPARREAKRVLPAVALAVLGTAALAAYWAYSDRVPARPPNDLLFRSVAVVPFANLSGRSDDEYLSDGLSDEVIATLSRVNGLRVAARSSSYFYKGKARTAPLLGRELGVRYLVEGGVLRAGDSLRVTVYLEDALSQSQLWSEVYDRDATGVLALQEEIARSIADTLLVKLGGAASSGSLSHASTANPESYDLYLQGRYFWNQRTAASLSRAIGLFRQALDRDSSNARAWAGLADSYSLLGNFGNLPPREAMPQAKAAALRAAQLDSTLAEAQTSLGVVSMFYEWDWPAAERYYRRALALNPRYATGHLFYAWYLFCQGRHEDALREMKMAQSIEPLSVTINARVGSLYRLLSRYDEAVPFLKRAMSLDSSARIPRADLGLVYAQTGRFQEAFRLLPPIEEHVANFEGGFLGYGLARAGRREEALRTVHEMERFASSRYVSGDAIAAVYAGLGDADRAFAALDRAERDHAFTLVFVGLEPMFASLRSDPRFRQLLEPVHVPLSAEH